MRENLLKFALVTLVGFWLVGCSTATINAPAAPPPLPPSGGAPLLSDAQVEAARSLYIAKCANCHKFHDPARYDDAEWNKWMTKMSRKAKLKPDQEELLSQYLGLFRANLSASPAETK